jgi:hypothetical protein
MSHVERCNSPLQCVVWRCIGLPLIIDWAKSSKNAALDYSCQCEQREATCEDEDTQPAGKSQATYQELTQGLITLETKRRGTQKGLNRALGTLTTCLFRFGTHCAPHLRCRAVLTGEVGNKRHENGRRLEPKKERK